MVVAFEHFRFDQTFLFENTKGNILLTKEQNMEACTLRVIK